MAERQQWEAETFRAFRAVLSDEAARRPGAWVLDLGGWIGVTGLYAAQFAPQVLAFEPDPAARSELVRGPVAVPCINLNAGWKPGTIGTCRTQVC